MGQSTNVEKQKVVPLINMWNRN